MNRSGISGTSATENGELGMNTRKRDPSSWLNHQRWIVMISMGLIVTGFWLLWRKKVAH